MTIEESQIRLLYAKAKAAFHECAASQAPQVREESGIHYEAIKVRCDSVRICFSGVGTDAYLVETKLNLLAEDGEPIGWYCIHEDEDGSIVDDYLVFD